MAHLTAKEVFRFFFAMSRVFFPSSLNSVS
jgi:hypothetical protein